MTSKKLFLAAAGGAAIIVAATIAGLTPVDSQDVADRPVVSVSTPPVAKHVGPGHEKPQPPMRIVSSLSGTVDSGTEYEVALTFSPTQDCSGLETEVRGLEGLVVEFAGVRAHETCRPGKSVVRTVQVRVPAGVAGYLVADADFTAGEQRYLATQVFAIKAKGAVRKLEPAGRVRVDTTGQPLVIMKSAAPADR